ncbi:MAG: hypothetical protein Kow0069_32740 [Promethearchaeota archaeon]
MKTYKIVGPLGFISAAGKLELVYDELKVHGRRVYSGMRVGGRHSWVYPNGRWTEAKVEPDLWKVRFNSLKTRVREAPAGSGAPVGTQYHWFVVADQLATKRDANTYQTTMEGLKFKVGHKRTSWRRFSYEYEGNSYEDRVIEFLEDTLARLKAARSARTRLAATPRSGGLNVPSVALLARRAEGC